MKRILSIIMAITMIFSVTAGAQNIDEFLSQAYTNYSAGYELNMTFESGSDLGALLNEIEIPEEVGRFADLKALAVSVFSYDMKMNLQADISEDYKKAEMAVTYDSVHNIDVNSNLNIGINSKTGMWIKIDLTESSPAFEMTFSAPVLNKYMHMDLFEMAEDESEKEQILNMLKNVFSKEYISGIQEISVGLMKKHADIKLTSGKCVVKIDNDGLIAMISELMPIITEMTAEMMLPVADTETSDFLPEAEADMESIVLGEMPSFEGLTLLGDEGITYTYTLKSGKISDVAIDADMCIDIESICEQVFGMSWEFEANGKFELNLSCKGKVKDIDETKVEFPKLTEENSVNLAEKIKEETAKTPATPEYMPQYPRYYVGGESEKLIVLGGRYYVPLRRTIEDAYGANVEFDKGVITITSEYFPEFTEMKLTSGSDMVYTDGKTNKIDKVIIENGTTYVSAETFEKLLGWELCELTHDILGNTFYYGFITETDDETEWQ